MKIKPVDTHVQIDLTSLPEHGSTRRLAGALDALAILQRQANRPHGRALDGKPHDVESCALCLAVCKRAARTLMLVL